MFRHNLEPVRQLRRVAGTCALALSLSMSVQAEPQFSIADRGSVRLGDDNTLLVDYVVSITAGAEDLAAVTVTVRSSSEATVVTDASLTFGDVAAGSTAISQDTFTIRHDLTQAYDLSVIDYVIDDDDTEIEIDVTVNDDNTTVESLSSDGGALDLNTTGNAAITVSVPEFAVLEDTAFSATEITSLTGLPEGIELVTGARLGPAGERFAQPVTLNFTITGQRTPGTALAAFIVDEDGGNLRWFPVVATDPGAGIVETARFGERVSVATFGFSDVGLVEVTEAAIEFLNELADDADSINLDALSTILEFALGEGIENEEDLAKDNLETLVRNARSGRESAIEGFTNRDVMAPGMIDEFRDLVLRSLITEQLAESLSLTTRGETIVVYDALVNLSAAYVAGLHLRCFADPSGIDDVLPEAQKPALLAVNIALLAGVPGPSFQEIAGFAARTDTCYAQEILDPYFESLNTDDDFFLGTATNVVRVEVDVASEEREVITSEPFETTLRFFGPSLISTTPLRIGFERVEGPLLTGGTVTAELLFNPPNIAGRTALLNVATFQRVDFVGGDGDEPGFQENDDSFFGEVTISPNSFLFDLDIVTRTRLDPVGPNEGFNRTVTGDFTGARAFTPLGFVDEVE
ncbi:MAG: hypothetical protein AAGF61_02890 [Pseudomonadota bacterium]